MGVLGCSMTRRKSRASIELGVQTNDLLIDSGNYGIDSSGSKFKFNVQNPLRVDSSSPELVPMSGGACGANDSVYGNSRPSGVVSGRGPPANVPERMGPRRVLGEVQPMVIRC
ncbi:hypothetical protein PIB30_032936 [Stylosanthes scabra]|uniref:Uncharacterized protein n=1 Tax=Stylosanthes scabra TaxID=79078 RepID=A0ABU6XD83_9FABA|nr:hypothetical protein [Stylosanthes scabra]